MKVIYLIWKDYCSENRKLIRTFENPYTALGYVEGMDTDVENRKYLIEVRKAE